jgi:hypothetical protein
MPKAPLTQESVWKNERKRPMLVNTTGVPLVLVVTWANYYGASLRETMTDSLVIEQPDIFRASSTVIS